MCSECPLLAELVRLTWCSSWSLFRQGQESGLCLAGFWSLCGLLRPPDVLFQSLRLPAYAFAVTGTWTTACRGYPCCSAMASPRCSCSMADLFLPSPSKKSGGKRACLPSLTSLSRTEASHAKWPSQELMATSSEGLVQKSPSAHYAWLCRSRDKNLAKAVELEAQGDKAAYDFFQRSVDITPDLAKQLIEVIAY